MGSVYQQTCPQCFEDAVENDQCSKCGFSQSEAAQYPMALKYMTVLKKRYLIGRVLGVGGFGITYFAKDLDSCSLCAIKEYLPTGIASRSSGALSVSVIDSSQNKIYRHGLTRFIDEAMVLRSLSGTRGIVRAFDHFEANNTGYLVMEYIRGVTLRRLVRNSNGRIQYHSAMKILKEAARGLRHVHARGLLHRDISPENIFITKKGETKLIDFGAARYFLSERSQSLSIVLKPGYAPPEQYSSRGNQGPWTDIYALASTLYFAMSGINVPSALERLSGNKIQLLHHIDADIPKHVSYAIDKALELDLRSRYQSIEALLAGIDEKRRMGFSEGNATPRRCAQHEFSRSFSKSYRRGHALKVPFIIAVSGLMNGRKWRLDPNRPVQIGRSGTQCRIVVRDVPSISRIHCIVWYDEVGSVFFVQDCSRNGTFSIDGRRFENGRKNKLASGDSFYLVSRSNTLRLELK